jgi:hypothetical protein
VVSGWAFPIDRGAAPIAASESRGKGREAQSIRYVDPRPASDVRASRRVSEGQSEFSLYVSVGCGMM